LLLQKSHLIERARGGRTICQAVRRAIVVGSG